MAEQFTNFGFTNLDGSLDNSTTTVVVVSAATFPSTAPYRITVDQEIMIVTAGAGTTSWTVTRGAESSTAASHSSGAVVAQTLTKASLTKIIQDTSPQTLADASAPNNLVYYSSDASKLVYKDPSGVVNALY